MVSGTLVFEEEQLRIPADVFNLDGFLRWVHSPKFPQQGRISFLGGEVNLDMGPEEIQTHNFVKADLGADLAIWIREHDLGRLFADRALLVNDEADLSTEPDLMFCCWETLRQDRLRLVERTEGSGRYVQVDGSPDLVVEIVSETSVNKDTRKLRTLFFAAGVEEYWLVDARKTELDFQIISRGKEKFESVKPDADGFRHSEVLGGSFRLARETDRVGGSQYRLLSST